MGRTYNHRQWDASTPAHHDSNGSQGKNWFQTSTPEILLYDADSDSGTREAEDVLYIVYGADRYIELVRTDDNVDTFRARNGAAGVAVFATNSTNEPETYTYTDGRGLQITFLGFDPDAGSATGQFWKMTDPAGNTAYVGSSTLSSSTATTGYSSGRITTVYDSADRRYSYTYSTIDGKARLTQVVAETKSGGTWASPTGVAEVDRVDYAYYQTGDNTYGDNGNLKLITVTTPLSDTSLSSVRKTHFRYWTGTYNSSTNPGHPNFIKYVIDPEGYRRADWADSNLSDDDPLMMDMSVTGNKAYASVYLEYDSNYRVTEFWQNGQCGCGDGSINGVYTITYNDSSSLSTYLATAGYDQGWGRRATVGIPDGSARTFYFDETGQSLSSVVFDDNPTGSPSITRVYQVDRDKDGIVESTHTPSRNSTYAHSTGVIVPDTTSAEGVKTTSLILASSGDLDALSEGRRKQNAVGGDNNYVTKNTLTSRTYLPYTGVGVTQPLVSKSIEYPVATTNASDASRLETSMSYTWYEASDATDVLYIVPKAITTTYPAVTTAHNGSNSSNSTTTYFREDGTTAFVEAADGTFTYTAYTNGQLTKQIRDCQTNHGSDFGSDDPNTAFGITGTGDGLRLVTTYTYDPQGRPDTTTMPDGRVSQMYYSKLADGRMVTVSIPHVTSGGSTTYYGPASYTVTNLGGKVEATGIIAISSSGTTMALSSWIDDADADPITALDVGSLASFSTRLYDETGMRLTESRAYFDIPASGTGSSGTNYDATTLDYDSLGRQYKTTTPAGTITKKTYDDLGRVVSTYIGTVDGGGSDNMVKVNEVEYGDSSGKASGLVVKRTQYVVDGTTNRRDTYYTYDDRDQLVVTQSPQSPHSVVKYDNLGRVVARGLYSSASSLAKGSDPTTDDTDRIGLSETFYDDIGQVYKTVTHEIDESDGSDDDTLTTYMWYDSVGRAIKSKGPSGIHKTIYDRIGRPTSRFAIADDGGETSYTDMDDVTGDKVLEQSIISYGNIDTALIGKVQMSATISRWHDDTTTTGALDTNADSNDTKFTEGNIKGRISINVSWMDELGRVTNTTSYGTNGMIDSSGHDFDLAPSSVYISVPTRSNTVLVSTTTYDTAGRVVETEASGKPDDLSGTTGMKTHYLFDDLGRRIAEIHNYTAGSTTTADRDNDLYTRSTYANGLRTKYWVDLDGDGTEDSDDQVTIYTYGTTNGGTTGESVIASGDLLFKVQYPESSGGSDVVQYAYNAQGQQIWKKDQLGCIIESTFDTGGRETIRTATDLGSGSGLNGDVRRVEMSYTDRGQVDTVTQYDATSSGNVTDQVQYTYDNWGNITEFEQDVDSAIGSSGRGAFNVQYAYTKATPTNGTTRLRRTSMTYPGSIQLNYLYGTSGALNDQISRVYQLEWNASTGTYLAQYEYLGAGQVARTSYPQPNVYTASYRPTAAGGTPHEYEYLDRFGRVTHSYWRNAYEISGTITGTHFYDATLEYDRLSNILSTDDNVAYGTGAGQWADVRYGLDGLGRLTDANEGELSSGSISSPSTRRETWMDGSNLGLSQTGNWLRRKQDLNGDGDYTDYGEIDDTGIFNKANEWLTRDTDSNSSVNYTLAHDAAGNLTDDGKSYKYVYDAFGRLMEVKNQSNTTIEKFRYNGLGFRIMWQYDANTNSSLDNSDRYYFCYDERWRVVETYRDQDSSPKERFVYNAAGQGGFGGGSYVDNSALRDRDANTAWTSASDGSLEQRTYLCRNWRNDLVAAVDASTSSYGLYVKQRFKYDAYGSPRFYGLNDYNHDGGGTIDDAIAFEDDYSYGRDNADSNFDGGVTIDDYLLYWAAYSAAGPNLNLRQLYAGYEWDSVTQYGSGLGWYHVRHRVMLTELGRWNKRDILDYIDGSNLFEYASSRPVYGIDFLGLQCSSCTHYTASYSNAAYDSPTSLPPIPRDDLKYLRYDCQKDVGDYIFRTLTLPRCRYELTQRRPCPTCNLMPYFELVCDPRSSDPQEDDRLQLCEFQAIRAGYMCCIDQGRNPEPGRRGIWRDTGPCIAAAARQYATCRDNNPPAAIPPNTIQWPSQVPARIFVDDNGLVDCWGACERVRDYYLNWICKFLPPWAAYSCNGAAYSGFVSCTACCMSHPTTDATTWIGCIQEYVNVVDPFAHKQK
ncbi:MAG: hypothetical protein AB7Q00_07955 [Phycisphaerales bacterium]